MKLAVTALGLSLLAALAPRPAEAYSRGVSFDGCSGCHGTGEQTMSVTMDPSEIAPGSRARARITIRGSGAVAGLFAGIDAGTVDVISGGGAARTEGGITHDGPRTMSGGVATFEVWWTAPSTPGSVRFAVSSVDANGNGRSSGDGAADADFDFVYGCEPQEYYRDFDGDGHGQARLSRTHCVGGPPEGYSELSDDCNDSDERANPAAEEVCNGRDDDCDEVVDEGADPVTHYPDGDRDGYYSAGERETEETFFGCGPMGGEWAAQGGDCAPTDPAVNPGAEDVCNGRDDDCDLDVDERVRPQCGQGWCRRNSPTCNAEDCVPGDPRDETCNYFDDDCDGAVDESSCPSGQVCGDFECVPDDGDGSDGGGGGGGGTGEGPGSGSSGGCSAGSGDAPRGVFVACLLLALIVVRRSSRRPPR